MNLDFERRVINTNEFLFIIDAGHIYYSIMYYERYVKSCVIVMGRVCYYCRMFVYLLSLFIILRSGLIVIII